MIQRALEATLLDRLFKGKAIVVTGPRQTGKTTLVKRITSNAGVKALYLNADEPDVSAELEGASSTLLKRIIGSNKIVVIDEAQRITNIGLTLKLITDEIKDVQLIVTGSSSLDLADRIKEPLTGRKYEYNLYPLSYAELESHNGYIEERRLLESRMVYGSYPDVVARPGEELEILTNLADTYLYKDLLSLEQVRRPELLGDILEALALQLGNEVRYTEIGDIVGANEETVKKYIYLLEKTFVIFRIRAFSRNLRNEIKRSRKIYFYDNGIRNAIIRDFKPLGMRTDVGGLWENFMMTERLKFNAYQMRYARMWFWRTKQKQEIDLIEEVNTELAAIEFKWSPKKKVSWPRTFTSSYPNARLISINREEYSDFLTKSDKLNTL